MDCVAGNLEDTVPIGSRVSISIACGRFAGSHRIHSPLWARQGSIKVSDEACESLRIVSHC